MEVATIDLNFLRNALAPVLIVFILEETNFKPVKKHFCFPTLANQTAYMYLRNPHYKKAFKKT